MSDISPGGAERPAWWNDRDERNLERVYRDPVEYREVVRCLVNPDGAHQCRLCVYWLSGDGRRGGCHLYGETVKPLPTNAEDGCGYWLPHPPA